MRFYSNKRIIIYLICICLFFVLLGIGQDFFQSVSNNSSFYLSESSIYKIIWFLFIPFLLVGVSLTKNYDKFHTHYLFYAIPFSIVLSFVHLYIASIAVYILSSLLLDHTYSSSRVFKYFIYSDLGTVSLIYMASFTFLIINQKIHQFSNKVVQKDTLDIIHISLNNKIIHVDVKDIIYIKTERPYISIVTKEKRYLHNSSLKTLLTKLDPDIFIRVHSSTIVNVDHIDFVKSRANGDYDITMSNGGVIRMSRNYSKAYKSLIQNNLQLS